MYDRLHALLSDRTGGAVFSCFGLFHLGYLCLLFITVLILTLVLRSNAPAFHRRFLDHTVGLAFALYLADFFLMPFAYGEIDLEKLPFHICTLSCVLCFLSRHRTPLARWKDPLTVLVLVGNLIYACYPAGIAWYQIHPLSYRAVQTLLFHGVMVVYAILALALKDVRLTSLKQSRHELLLLTAMAAWAMLGNALYNGTYQGKTHCYNWFFVLRDPFYLLPENIAPYLMPLVMIAVLYIGVLLVYGMVFLIRRLFREYRKTENVPSNKI